MGDYRTNGKHLLSNKGGHPASLRGRNLTESGKICTKCSQEKPLTEFRSEKTSHCKKCILKYLREYDKKKRQRLW